MVINSDWIVQLVQATQDAVVTIDAEHRIMLFNSAAEAMFGYRAEEVQGKDVNMLMPEPYHSEHGRYVSRYEETGEAHAIGRIRTVTARRRNGEEFPIELSVTRVEGGQARYGAFIRDISDKVRLQQELVQREKLAAIGTTAAKFAHEVSNPLNGMFTQVQLMKRRLERSDDSDPRILRGVEHLYGDLERLNNLLDEFRSLSRRQDYRFDAVLIQQACADVAALREGVHAEQGVELEVNLPEDLPAVRADAAKLKQVLHNLCKNAEEAMPQGGTLSVSARVDGLYAVLSIADTGVGIPDGVDVFAPFATTKETGTGLGLPIVAEIVAAHGGTVSFASCAGEGTRFDIALPIAESVR